MQNEIGSGKTDIAQNAGEILFPIAKPSGRTVDDRLNERRGASSFPLNRIKELVAPVAEKYRLRSVYVFGSYARNEATESSDVDLLIDREGAAIRGIFGMNALFNDLKEALGKEIDLVTLQALEQKSTISHHRGFIDTVMKERVKIYG